MKKAEVVRAVEREIDHVKFPRHLVQIMQPRTKVVVRLLAVRGPVDIEISTEGGGSLAKMGLDDLRCELRKLPERQQSDIEDFTTAGSCPSARV